MIYGVLPVAGLFAVAGLAAFSYAFALSFFASNGPMPLELLKSPYVIGTAIVAFVWIGAVSVSEFMKSGNEKETKNKKKDS